MVVGDFITPTTSVETNFVRANHETLLKTPKALEYLEQRKVPLGITYKYQLGFKNDKRSILRDRILFPIHDEYGNFLAYQGRAIYDDIKPKYWHNKLEKSTVLYGLYECLELAIQTGYVVLTEGNFNPLALATINQPGVAMMGSAFSDQHGLMLRRYVKDVVVFTDPDEAGEKSQDRIFETLATCDLTGYTVINSYGKDPAQIYEDHGPEALAELFTL